MQQGESDDDALGTTTAQYISSGQEVIASVRAVGCQAPILWSRETYDGAYMSPAQAARIRAGQMALGNGPDIDTIPEAQRQPPTGPHLMTDPGPDTAAGLWLPFL